MNILRAGLQAAAPDVIFRRILRRKTVTIGRTKIRMEKYDKIKLVSFGKAGLSMARAFDSTIKVAGGIIVVPMGVQVPKRSKFTIIQSTHPNPSSRSMSAARAIMQYIAECRGNCLVVFLVSGGASALVSLPRGISLDDTVSLNRLLLRAGANIAEINCVRKHLSAVKGGQMVSGLKCDAIALLMSDVKANDMSTIASGMTYCDRTTFADALDVIKKYGLENEIPRAVARHLRSGMRGRVPETPKRPRIKNFVIASNSNCIAAMKTAAVKMGYDVRTSVSYGKIERQAGLLARAAPEKSGSCLVFGGETTVFVRGNGRGGRNQEMVLQIVKRLRGDAVVGAIGTDGIDGNTKSAGGLISTSDADRTEIKKYLKSSNSNGYLRKHGGLINTGYTQTNLLDIGIILR